MSPCSPRRAVLLIGFAAVACATPSRTQVPPPNPAPARPVVLTGRVVDDSTGQPVVGAQVFFPALRVGTVTDAEGAYLLYAETALGGLERLVRRIGYQSARDTVLVAPGGSPVWAERPLRAERYAPPRDRVPR